MAGEFDLCSKMNSEQPFIRKAKVTKTPYDYVIKHPNTQDPS
jgi:hypothetical protein